MPLLRSYLQNVLYAIAVIVELLMHLAFVYAALAIIWHCLAPARFQWLDLSQRMHYGIYIVAGYVAMKIDKHNIFNFKGQHNA